MKCCDLSAECLKCWIRCDNRAGRQQKEEKGPLSKLPVAEPVSERRGGVGGDGGGQQRLSAKTACPRSSARGPARPETRSLAPSFLIRRARFRVEALLIGHPSETHAESKLPATDWRSLS
ncbi:hypothetical protein CesoFtcFv8_014602 [Champsocephalus esox]|uniref:Uncharacterized protein n=1 Tax=Champsocephalus esox TaxID=159716 RepID=A0AAN8BNW3_9TELE|nr:hypothetical protein CesoFtcFv8_014602 [Champsocephalus esox]